MLVRATVLISILFVFLSTTGVVGRSARSGEPTVETNNRQLVNWVDKHLEKHNVSTRSCVDLSDWIDFYEDSCDWYEENEAGGCPNEGNVTGTDNVTASEACCHCHANFTDRITSDRINDTSGNQEKAGSQSEALSYETAIGGAFGIIVLFVCVFSACAMAVQQ